MHSPLLLIVLCIEFLLLFFKRFPSYSYILKHILQSHLSHILCIKYHGKEWRHFGRCECDLEFYFDSSHRVESVVGSVESLPKKAHIKSYTYIAASSVCITLSHVRDGLH